MARDEQGFPIIPHEVATGADCCGCLIVQVRGDQADITCNECGAVVRTVPVELASAVMVEIASTQICSARCTHCGALNTFSGFSASDPAAELPSPEVAWEFLHNNVYGDGEIERPTALPEFLTQQFKHDYHRHLRNLSRAS